METNFNFKSQICTTRGQSECLLALGLKKETADMYLQSVLNDEWSPFVPIAFPYSDRPEEIIATDVVHAIPAWSLHRLLCIIPKHIQAYDELCKFNRNFYLSIDKDFSIRYEENIDEPIFSKIFFSYDIYQNCVDAIEWLIKNGYFLKEYLV